MLARIRKSIDEKDQGFTLIELLVVMIIIGILAAIAIPVFLNQRKKAQDTATKSDVTTIGKEIAAYFVDPPTTANPAVGMDAKGNYYVGTATNIVGRRSSTSISEVKVKFTAPANQNWCVSVKNDAGANPIWIYTATSGLSASSTGCP